MRTVCNVTCQTDSHSIPGYRHCSGNAPSFLVCRMGDYRTVRGHSGHDVQVTSSLALKPHHVAETAAAEDETMIGGTLLQTLQVHSWHLETTGILSTQPANPSSRYWIVKAISSTLRLCDCILPHPEKIMELMQNAGLKRTRTAWVCVQCFHNVLVRVLFLDCLTMQTRDTAFLQNSNYGVTQCHIQEDW
jgi:hypothetical protein